MASRLDLQLLLEQLLESKNVYFQPPESIKMRYPAIVYSLNDIESKYADNGVYMSNRQYSLILVDLDPDSIYIDKIAKIPACQFSRYYSSDNLNHWVFELYF